MSNHIQKLIGSWQLISCMYTSEHGETVYPIGKNPKGLLTYTKEGVMSAQLMGDNRELFSTEDWMEASSAEIQQAFKSYQAYFGHYTIDEELKTISHHIEASLFPNWHLKGTTQVRYYEFKNNRLILTTDPFLLFNHKRTLVLKWALITKSNFY